MSLVANAAVSLLKLRLNPSLRLFVFNLTHPSAVLILEV